MVVALALPWPVFAAQLDIELTEIENDHGLVRVAVCTPATFTTTHCPFTAAAPAKPGSVVVSVPNVPPGRYAVQAYHDEDGNGRLRTRSFGLPAEAIGISRNARIRLGPPSFALQLGYASQEATLRAAVLGQFPALTLGPNYGSDTARVQTLGPSVSIGLPLFNGNRGVIDIARATREQLREDFAARRAAAEGGARAMLANLRLLQRQLANARAGLGQAQSLAADADRALRTGLLDQLSYVQLVSARLGKERQVIGVEQQMFDQRTALATLLGAGLSSVDLMLPNGPSL